MSSRITDKYAVALTEKASLGSLDDGQLTEQTSTQRTETANVLTQRYSGSRDVFVYCACAFLRNWSMDGPVTFHLL